MVFNTARRGRKMAFFEDADYGALSKQDCVVIRAPLSFTSQGQRRRME